MKKLFYLLLGTALLFPAVALADMGVGVGTGKIQVDEKLSPGLIYKLPSLSVINTGTVTSDYEVTISYHEKQPELRPDESWFNFSPKKFELDPGEVQVVEININLPLKMEPGDYFAYLEAHPLGKVESGNATIGVAAAAKLYFTVVPANVFSALYYKVLSFWNVYAPWPQRVLIGLVVISLILIFKKYFNFEINMKKPQKHSEKTDHDTKE